MKQLPSASSFRSKFKDAQRKGHSTTDAIATALGKSGEFKMPDTPAPSTTILKFGNFDWPTGEETLTDAPPAPAMPPPSRARLTMGGSEKGRVRPPTTSPTPTPPGVPKDKTT